MPAPVGRKFITVIQIVCSHLGFAKLQVVRQMGKGGGGGGRV